MKNIYIFGSSGQDGRLLVSQLERLGTDYTIVMFTRTGACSNGAGDKRFRYEYTPNSFSTILAEVARRFPPDAVFYLAARHYSSTEIASGTADKADEIYVNEELPSLILLFLSEHYPSSHFIYASSSLVFSGSNVSPQTEASTRAPICSYGWAKYRIELLCSEYERKGRLRTAVLILYNHESVYRARKFFSAKVLTYALDFASQGNSSGRPNLCVYNPDRHIDMGYAQDFINAMIEVMRLGAVGSFVVSTGSTVSVRQFVERVFDNFKVPVSFVDYSTSSERSPTELVGDSSKIKGELGWSPQLVGIDVVDQLCRDYQWWAR